MEDGSRKRGAEYVWERTVPERFSFGELII